MLNSHISMPQFLSQIEQLAYGSHTGSLEVFHSLILTYAPKRLDFDVKSYNGRVQLAVLDHNENVGRKVLQGRLSFSNSFNMYMICMVVIVFSC